MAIGELKGHKSPGMDHIPAELVKGGGRTILSEIPDLLILLEIISNCLRSGISRSFYLFIRRVIKQIVEACNVCQVRTKFYPTLIISSGKLLGVHHCGLRLSRSSTDHIFCVRQILEKNGNMMKQFISQTLRKDYDSVRREVLYNILIEFGIPMKLVRIIKMCLSETCSRVRVFKHLSDIFPVNNGLKQGDALT